MHGAGMEGLSDSYEYFMGGGADGVEAPVGEGSPARGPRQRDTPHEGRGERPGRPMGSRAVPGPVDHRQVCREERGPYPHGPRSVP